MKAQNSFFFLGLAIVFIGLAIFIEFYDGSQTIDCAVVKTYELTANGIPSDQIAVEYLCEGDSDTALTLAPKIDRGIKSVTAHRSRERRIKLTINYLGVNVRE